MGMGGRFTAIQYWSMTKEVSTAAVKLRKKAHILEFAKNSALGHLAVMVDIWPYQSQ